jgi:hypothetical protein
MNGIWTCPFDCDKFYSFYGSLISHLEAFHPIQSSLDRLEKDVTESTLESLAAVTEMEAVDEIDHSNLMEELQGAIQEQAHLNSSSSSLYNELDQILALECNSAEESELKSSQIRNNDFSFIANVEDQTATQTWSHENLNFITQDSFECSLNHFESNALNDVDFSSFIAKDVEKSKSISKSSSLELIEDSVSNYSMSSNEFSMHGSDYISPTNLSSSADWDSTIMGVCKPSIIIEDSDTSFCDFSDISSNSRLTEFFECFNEIEMNSDPAEEAQPMNIEKGNLDFQDHCLVNDDHGDSSVISCLQEPSKENNKQDQKKQKKSKKKNRFSKNVMRQVTKNLKKLYKDLRKAPRKKRTRSSDVIDDETLWNSVESKRTINLSKERLERYL